MIQCEDECERPWLGPALVGGVATVLAAAVAPLIEGWREDRKRRRQMAARLARLEALHGQTEDEE